MKAIKSLLLVICFLSAFSVAAYADSGNCFCSVYAQSQGSVYHQGLIWVPTGVTANWSLQVVLNNEEPYNTAYAQAGLKLAIEESLSEELAGYTYGPQYFYKSGSYTNNSGSSAPVEFYCVAQIWGSDTGGGASGSAFISW